MWLFYEALNNLFGAGANVLQKEGWRISALNLVSHVRQSIWSDLSDGA